MTAIFQTTYSNAFSSNENVRISIKISLSVPDGPISDIPALVQIMASAPAKRQAIVSVSQSRLVYGRIILG